MSTEWCIPQISRANREWRVELPDGQVEQGSLEYVLGELAHTNLILPYDTAQTKANNYYGHAHDFEGVLYALLNYPESFSIAGFEDYYSQQEIDFLNAVQNKLRTMRKEHGSDNH